MYGRVIFISILAIHSMPIDYKDYAHNWKTTIVPAIRKRSGNKCEGSPKHPSCRAVNGEPHPDTGSMVVLTTAHMDHNKTNNYYHPIYADHPQNNLRHLCQRCHLGHDINEHVANRKYGRNHKGEHQTNLF